MYCPNCGQEMSDQDTICPACGQAIPAAPAPEEVPEVPCREEPSADQRPEAELEIESGPEPEAEAETDAAAEPEPDVAPEAETESEAETETETEPAEEVSQAEESPAEQPESGDQPKKKKHATVAIVLSAVICLLLIIVVCLTITLTTLSKTGSMPGFVTAISDFFHREHFDSDAVAAQVQDQDGNTVTELTNGEMGYYYWGEYYYYVQTNGFSFDSSLPLDEQSYSDDMTWQDYFLQNACASIQQIEALKAAAQEAGFTLTEDYQTEYDNTIAAMGDYAVQAGFTDEDGNGDVLAYIQDSYGSAATEESFAQYLYDSYYVTAYSDELYNGLSFTDEEVEQYFDDNADMFSSYYGMEKTDQPDVNVRHILIEPADTDEEDSAESVSEEAAWDDAKAEAERILKEWEDGDATEESFADLANTYSTDTGSNANGGLYTDVYPGQMVSEFNDWCFDPARKPGDTGIVKTSYGYHIIYFVSETDSYSWRSAAESELRYQTYNEELNTLVDRYSVVTTEDLAVQEPDAVEAIQNSAG